jgi:hypothetical protein
MGEALQASVNLATHEAYQNLTALLAAIQNATASLDQMGDNVSDAEKRARDMASSFGLAEQQFRQTGNEADRTRMEQLRTATQQATELAGNMRRRYAELETELQMVARTQTQTAETTVTANRRAAQSAESAANDTVRSTRNVRGGLSEIKDESGLVGGAVDALASSAKGMVLGFVGLQTIKQAMKELEENTKRTVEAINSVAGHRMEFESTVANVIDNLGLGRGAAGQQRAGKLVSALQEQTGVTAPVATELIAKAGITGFNPITDMARPDKDTQSQQFDIIKTVGQWSNRMRLDPVTAGKIFNMAQIAGFKTNEQVEGMLSMLESGLREIAISDPAQGMQTAIRSIAGRMSADRKMTFAQALAPVAAATIGETEASVAATNVEQFSRAAAGTTEPGKLFLGQQARQRGLITDEMMQRARASARTRLTTDSDEEIRRAQEGIETARRDMGIQAQERAEFERHAPQQRRELEKAREAAQLTPGRGRELGIMRADENLREYDERVKLQIQKRDEQRREAEKKIEQNQRHIGELQKKDQTAIDKLALQEAYAMVPLGQRETMVREMLERTPEAERGATVARFAEGDIQMNLLKQVAPGATAAYGRVLQGARRPDVAGLRASTREFYQSNTLALQGMAEAASERALLESGATGGEQMLTEVFGNERAQTETGRLGLVGTDIKILRARGEGGIGFTARAEAITRGATQEQAAATTGLTEEGLRARRAATIVYDRFRRWIANLDPRTRQRFDREIRDAWRAFMERYRFIFSDEFYFRTTGANQLRQAEEMTRDVGAFMTRINGAAGNANERISPVGIPGLGLPSSTPFTDHPFDFEPPASAGPGTAIEAATPSPAAGGGLAPTGATIPSGPPAPAAVGPRADAGPAVNYHINIGTHVSQAGESLNFDPRLGQPDLS